MIMILCQTHRFTSPAETDEVYYDSATVTPRTSRSRIPVAVSNMKSDQGPGQGSKSRSVTQVGEIK